MKILAIVIVFSIVKCQKQNFNVDYEWRRLEYAYATPKERQKAITDGSFVPGNGFPIDTDVYYPSNDKKKQFVTIPRFSSGIPATLATVTDNTFEGNPLLEPYPSWSWHQNSEKCNKHRLVCVFRTEIDECGRLWVLDSGKIIDKQLCHPQILAFDLKTNRLVHNYDIPMDQIHDDSFLVTPLVDIRNKKCEEAFVYIADVSGFGLIVYDAKNKKSWRIVNRYMFPVPDHGKFDITGETFYLMDGIFGLALSPPQKNQERTLYFHSLASLNENHVPASVIRNQSIFEGNEEAVPQYFQTFPKQRSSQSAAQAMDKNGVLFFSLLKDTSIACWNSRNEFNPRSSDVLIKNETNLQFPSGLKIVKGPDGDRLSVLSCRFQKIMAGTMDQENEVNFRIMSGKIEDLLGKNKCKSTGPAWANYASGLPSKPNKRYGQGDIIFKDD